ncbi:MAG: hypothetical protein U0792_04530 [Gemmataceae bacterium]
MFTLLVDMYVLAVNEKHDLHGQVFPGLGHRVIPGGRRTAKLIELATKLECNLSAFYPERHGGIRRRQTERAAYDKVFTMLTELAKHRELHIPPPPREVGER